MQRGLDLAEAALEADVRSADQDRELKYLAAVAQYNLGSYIRARRAVRAVMDEYPDFRCGTVGVGCLVAGCLGGVEGGG